MGVTSSEIDMGIAILRDLGATRIWLFGSALRSPATARDIDFGCEGLPPERFFRAAGSLISRLGRSVDLVDLSPGTRRARFIRDHAKLMYEAR